MVAQRLTSTHSRRPSFPRAPGLVVLPAFFSPDEQKELVASCLVDYTQPPNRTNLDQHFILPQPPSTLWSLYSDAVSRAPADNDQDAPAEAVLQPRHATLTAEDALNYARMPDGRQLVQNTPGEELTPADVALTGAHLPEPSRSARTTPVTKLLKELRWTNIGLFYDVRAVEAPRVPPLADMRSRLRVRARPSGRARTTTLASGSRSPPTSARAWPRSSGTTSTGRASTATYRPTCAPPSGSTSGRPTTVCLCPPTSQRARRRC